MSLGKQPGCNCSRAGQQCRPIGSGRYSRPLRVGMRRKQPSISVQWHLTRTLLLQSSSRVASIDPVLAEGADAVGTIDAERALSNASASSSGRTSYDRDGSYQPYGSRLKLRKARRPPGWMHYLGDDYLPQQLSQVWPHERKYCPALKAYNRPLHDSTCTARYLAAWESTWYPGWAEQHADYLVITSLHLHDVLSIYFCKQYG